ncbi:MAG: hypothetical protein NKF70_12225 [Methanobacterium sp. ERen5]|nr:MAG: hypothetical protein NKF70_12225 [Methanobacterium sp. ERen5]
MSGMGEKARTVVSGVGDKVSSSDEGSVVDSVGEKVSGLGEKIKGTVKSVPKSASKSTDDLSLRIDDYLDEKSSQLIVDWELATNNDIENIENKYSKVTQDLSTLDSNFSEYRAETNDKIKKIEERLEKLEKP